MANLNNFAGFDVSKDFFDLCLLADGKQVVAERFTNDQKGFEQSVQSLPVGTHCVMEATGPYYLPLACWLHQQGLTVSVVNPLVIHRFGQMRLQRVKTDKADARLIAQYGSQQQPAAWEPPLSTWSVLGNWRP